MSDLIGRKDAIDALWKIKDERDSVYYTSAIHSSIDAIERLPSAEKRTNERTKTHECDLISRQAAIDYVDCGHLRPPTELVWSDLAVVNMLKQLPSAKPDITHLQKEQAYMQGWEDGRKNLMEQLPSAESERKTGQLSNKEWIDFLVAQFDISRTSARDMLHVMMQVKREDNFKKQFSQRNGCLVKDLVKEDGGGV